MQIRNEGAMKYKSKNHLQPKLQGYHEWRVQMTFLVFVSMKTKIPTSPIYDVGLCILVFIQNVLQLI